MSRNTVPSLIWVKRGIAKRTPDRLVLEENELSNLIKLAPSQEESDADTSASDSDGSDTDSRSDADREENNSDKSGEESSDELENDDASDDSADNDTSDESEEDSNSYGSNDSDVDDAKQDSNPVSFSSIACFSSNKEDPYLQDDKDSDDEDAEILPEDNLVVACKTQGIEEKSLEVYVYNNDDKSLYVHHDIHLLDYWPLALEWLDYDPGEPDTPGNLIAMGSMEPDISIWDIDIVDSLDPAYVLSGVKRKKLKNKKVKLSGHTDAVLDLSWNRNQRHYLASASVDNTVGLWNLDEGKMTLQITQHEQDVQTVEWHPKEATSLLTGGSDGIVNVFDARDPTSAKKSWKLCGEVEKVSWNRNCLYQFMAGTNKGKVHCYDIRSSNAVFKFRPHTSEITGIGFSSQFESCMYTCAVEGVIKVWDVRSSPPSPVAFKEPHVGKLYSMMCSPDDPFVVAVGGEREVKVFNLESKGLASHFQSPPEAISQSPDKELDKKPKKKVSSTQMGDGINQSIKRKWKHSEELTSSNPSNTMQMGKKKKKKAKLAK